jgi:hypothetical protein
MRPTRLPNGADAVTSNRADAISLRSAKESVNLRVLGVAAWLAFALFVYVLVSSHSATHSFSTTEGVLIVTLIGLVIRHP